MRLLALVSLPLAVLGAEAPDLAAELAALRVPPAWLAKERTDYDTSQPWKTARLHIRKLLDERRNREAILLTYDYLVRRKAAPNDHEYPLYLFLGGEHAWALHVYRERLRENPEAEGVAYLNLAALYRHYGKLAEAEKVLREGLKHLPKAPWDIPQAAKIHDRLGDLHAQAGRPNDAAGEYREAMRLLPTSRQPWGRQDIPKHVAKIGSKLALLERGSGEFGPLRDGTYRGSSIGYSRDVRVVVEVRAGKVTQVEVEHQEHIEQGATSLVPQAIVATQSLEVDAVTGATVTSQAIVAAVHQAARRAGMK